MADEDGIKHQILHKQAQQCAHANVKPQAVLQLLG